MFSVGIPIDACLRSLAAQMSPDFAATIVQVERQLCRGQTLSHCLEQYPEVFHRVHCQMVRVGENSGALEVVFGRLAAWEESRARLDQKLRAALIAPFWIGGLCLLIAVCLPPLLMQGLLPVFEGLELPWYSRALVAFSMGLRSPGFWVLTLLLLGLLRWLYQLHSKTWKRAWQRGAFRIPVLGRTLEWSALLRCLQALETLLDAGAPLLFSLELGAGAADQEVLEARMGRAVVAVRNGHDLGVALREEGFPPGMVVALQTGLESGRTPAMVRSLVRLFEIELEHSLELLTRACEPVFLLLIGGVVGFTVISLMVPLVKVVEIL